MALQDFIADTQYVEGDPVTCLLILKDGKGTVVGQVPSTGDTAADKAAALKQASDSATTFLGLIPAPVVNPNPAPAARTEWKPPTVK